MSESLYPYYERELAFIRQLSQDFAKRYPAVAGRLLLEASHSGDPHIERMIESFALLAGRIHHKLDDEFPELTDALLGVMYPHYLAPIPSMSIVQFDLDAERGQLPDGFEIARGSRLFTAPVRGLPCRFRTGYPVTLWPVRLVNAALQSPPFPKEYQPPRRTTAALRLEFECLSQLRFSDLSLDRLRLFLSGEGYVVAALYELLFNHVTQVVFRGLDGRGETTPGGPAASGEPPQATLTPDEALAQVGFQADEGLLPYPSQSFLGYRLLSEFFAFRDKFLFVDLSGWQAARRAGMGRRLEVVLFLNQTVGRLEEWIDENTFRLGCTPIVNLFEQVAEPISLSQDRYEYRLTPDVANPLGMEVYSVDSVTSVDPITAVVKEHQPFYSIRHSRGRDREQAFWHITRHPATQEGDRGTTVYLNLVDLDFQPRLPAESTLVVRTTCTNRDLPTQLQYAGERLYFSLEGAAPLAGIRCLRPPTVPLRPPPRRGRHWALVSHLTLNYLSLTDDVQGRDALREILRLYDFSDPQAGQQQLAEVTRQIIEGVAGVSCRRVVGRSGNGAAGGFCRGIEVTIELDEQKFVGTGMFLFASVLERFLGLYASLNSFTRLAAKTTQTDAVFKKWPLRAGEQQLL